MCAPRSLVKVRVWCQYSIRLDRLHRACPIQAFILPLAFTSFLRGIVHRYKSSWSLQLLAVTDIYLFINDTCELIGGCSLELGSATPLTASYIWHDKNQSNCLNSIEGPAIKIATSHYICRHEANSDIELHRNENN